MSYCDVANVTTRRIVITHPYPLNAPGGGTRSCLQIVHHLEQLGIDVILVPVSPNPDIETPADLTQVIPVPPNRLHYLLTGQAIARTVRQVLDAQPVDAVLGWSYEAAFLPQLLQSRNVTFGMIAAMPSYAEWMSRKTKLRFIRQAVDNWFRWRPFQCADVAFVSSQFTLEELTNLLHVDANRIVITGRGIDQIFSTVDRSHIPETISNFIFYGSLAPIKGVFDAIAALGHVAAKGYRNWKFKIAGWGNEEALQQAVHEHGITDQVMFLGCLEPDELVQELKWADLAILPSQAESFGRSIAEAQAAGLAVVSYRIGSIPEVVEEGKTGWLASPKQTEQLAEAIIAAMQSPETTFQMGLAGRDRITQKFSWKQTALSILQGIEAAKPQSRNR